MSVRPCFRTFRQKCLRKLEHVLNAERFNKFGEPLYPETVVSSACSKWIWRTVRYLSYPPIYLVYVPSEQFSVRGRGLIPSKAWAQARWAKQRCAEFQLHSIFMAVQFSNRDYSTYSGGQRCTVAHGNRLSPQFTCSPDTCRSRTRCIHAMKGWGRPWHSVRLPPAPRHLLQCAARAARERWFTARICQNKTPGYGRYRSGAREPTAVLDFNCTFLLFIQ